MVWMRVVQRGNQGHGRFPFPDLLGNQNRRLPITLHQKVHRPQTGEIQEPGTIGFAAESADGFERLFAAAATPARTFDRADLPSSLPVTLCAGIIFTVRREQNSDRYLLGKYSLKQSPGTKRLIIWMGCNDQDFVRFRK